MNFFDNCFWNVRRRRRRRRNCRHHRPSCKEKNAFIHPLANNSTAKTSPFFFFFTFMMAEETHFAFRLSARGRKDMGYPIP